MGWVTKISAYVIPSVIATKQRARAEPIMRINLAFMSAGLRRLWYRPTEDVLCTSSRYKALRLLAFWAAPVFEVLAGIPDPSVVTTAA
jgi:hypothetical protein